MLLIFLLIILVLLIFLPIIFFGLSIYYRNKKPKKCKTFLRLGIANLLILFVLAIIGYGYCMTWTLDVK